MKAGAAGGVRPVMGVGGIDAEKLRNLEAALQAQPNARNAWSALSAGKQRSLAHMIASAKRSETKQARLEQVIAILLGEAPLPWARK